MFAAPDAAKAHSRLASVVDTLEAAGLRATLVLEANEELLAFMPFPPEHRVQLDSTNLPQRLNKEAARRSDVVGIYPTSPARFTGTLPIEANGEWLVGRRYLSAESLESLGRLYGAAEAGLPKPRLETTAVTPRGGRSRNGLTTKATIGICTTSRDLTLKWLLPQCGRSERTRRRTWAVDRITLPGT